MPAKPKPADASSDRIVIRGIDTGVTAVALIGESPLILNRPSRKALHELLLPRGRKTAADRQAELKHDPLAEFQAAPYRLTDEDRPTLLAVMASALKGAMMTAALDVPGAKKAQIGRLVFVQGVLVPVWGVPEMFMAVTRSADMNRTPDVRTRCIVPTWACLAWIRYVRPLLTETDVVNLLNAGGTTAGLGDWRAEKGKGTFGQFRVTNPEDPEFLAICKDGGRAEQIAAMEEPSFYDNETADLYAWFQDEVRVRGRAPSRGSGRANGRGEVIDAVATEVEA